MILRFTFRALIFSVLILGCSSDSDNGSSGDNNPPPPIDVLTVTERLQNIINNKVGNDNDKLVGVTVSIRVGTEERWKLVGGISKLNVPMTSDMRFGIASITKTVVGATIMKLIDNGILTLDDTIGDWLTLNNNNVDDSATIFQLLTHSSGINDYFFNSLWDKVETNLDIAITPEEISEYIGEPTNVPGVTHEYSNSNYLILGMIIEAATGKTVGEVMREKFWTPLNLNNIYFGANENIEGPIATPWRDNDGDGILEDISDQFGPAYHSVFYCAADVFSTASDLSMWAQHLYKGNAISEDSRQKMMTSYFEIPDPIFTGYGLGVRRVFMAERTLWGHTGGMRGYGSYMFYDPVSNVSIAMLNNQSRSADGPLLRHELVNELLTVVFAEM